MPEESASVDLDWGDEVEERAADAASTGAAVTRKEPAAGAPGSSGAPVVVLDDVDFSTSAAAVAGMGLERSSAVAAGPTAPEPIELPEVEGDDAIELAPAVEFVPQPSEGAPATSSGGGAPTAVAIAPPPAAEPATGQPGARPTPAAAVPADGGEAALRAALSQASRDVIEKIAWEVVPQLAETILREQIDRLVKERQR